MPSVTMPIHPYEDDIPAFALDALEPEEALQVREHLIHCPTCRAEVAAIRRSSECCAMRSRRRSRQPI